MSKVIIKNSMQLIGIFLVAISITFSACKSSTKSFTSNYKFEKKSKTELLDQTLVNQLDYKTIGGKMTFELQSPNSKKKAKTNAQIKLIRDSILQISIRPFSVFEAFRIDISPDKICIIDRLSKKYAEQSIKDLQQTQGAYFNFYNLQALITNSIFLPGEQEITPEKYSLFSISSANDIHLLKTKDKSEIQYNFAIDASNHLASTLIVSKNKDYTIQWSYSDFIKDENYIYPTLMKANIDIQKNRIDANINYSKLEIDKKLEIDNSIPREKYGKVSIKDIIAAYMKTK